MHNLSIFVKIDKQNFRRAREDERGATQRLNEMIANYGDVIPRRDFENLEKKHLVCSAYIYVSLDKTNLPIQIFACELIYVGCTNWSIYLVILNELTVLCSYHSTCSKIHF